MDSRFAWQRPVRIETDEPPIRIWEGLVLSGARIQLNHRDGSTALRGKRQNNLITWVFNPGVWEFRVNDQPAGRIHASWQRHQFQIGEHLLDLTIGRQLEIHPYPYRDGRFAIQFDPDDGRDHCYAIEAPDASGLLVLGAMLAVIIAASWEG